MVEILKTNQGEIDAGYVYGVTAFTRFGNYWFYTKDFCELVCSVARDPARLEARLLSYDDGTVNTVVTEFMNDLLAATEKAIDESRKTCDPQIIAQSPEVTRMLQRRRYLSLEQELSGAYRGFPVQVRISPDYGSIRVGMYEVRSDDFVWFSQAIARGGLSGWCDGIGPSFALPTLQAIADSQHPLFQKG